MDFQYLLCQCKKTQRRHKSGTIQVEKVWVHFILCIETKKETIKYFIDRIHEKCINLETVSERTKWKKCSQLHVPTSKKLEISRPLTGKATIWYFARRVKLRSLVPASKLYMHVIYPSYFPPTAIGAINSQYQADSSWFSCYVFFPHTYLSSIDRASINNSKIPPKIIFDLFYIYIAS